MTKIINSVQIGIEAGEYARIPLKDFYNAKAMLEIKFDKLADLMAMNLDLSRASNLLALLSGLQEHTEIDHVIFSSALESVTYLESLITESLALGSFMDISGNEPTPFDALTRW